MLVSLRPIAQNVAGDQIDRDYHQFRKVFNREVTSSDTSDVSNNIAIHPASLPEWLSILPSENSGSLISVGISDPGMAQEPAIELATLRAKMIAALLLKPQIKSITDNYSIDRSASRNKRFANKYLTYYRLLAGINSSPKQFETVYEGMTSFGEAIVVLKFNPSLPVMEDSDSLMLKVEMYQAERQKQSNVEFEEKCEVYGLSKNNNRDDQYDIFYYLFHAVNQFYEVVSRYNGETFEFPIAVFRYQNLNSAEINENYPVVAIKLTNGLWKSFLVSLVQQMVLLTEGSDVYVKQVGDQYKSSSQNLSRELAAINPQLTLRGLRVVNNQLSVILNTVNQY